MHDALYARFLRGLKERLGVLDGALEGRCAMREAYPVGIVEGAGSLQALDQRLWLIEAEREDSHVVSKGIGTVGMSGEGAHFLPKRQQVARDVFAGIAEGAGDDIHVGLGHDMGSS